MEKKLRFSFFSLYTTWQLKQYDVKYVGLPVSLLVEQKAKVHTVNSDPRSTKVDLLLVF